MITLEGINFQGTTRILFGDAEAAFFVTSDTQIQLTVPDGAVSGPLQFESQRGNSQNDVIFTVNTSAPFVETIEPLAVRTGELVRLTGRNLGNVTSILVGEIDARFSVVAENQISLIAPSIPTTGFVTLTNPGGVTQSTDMLVVTGLEPRISELDPAAGIPGDLITIVGGSFSTATNVWFGDFQAEFSIVADNQPSNPLSNAAPKHISQCFSVRSTIKYPDNVAIEDLDYKSFPFTNHGADTAAN